MSNYLEPYDVAEAVVQLIKSKIDQFVYNDRCRVSINSVREIASLFDGDGAVSVGMKPPWLGVYYNLDLEGDIMADGSPDSVPVEINILCCSSVGYENETKALRESMFYARQLVKVIPQGNLDPATGYFEINLGTEANPDVRLLKLECDPQPREIVSADPNMSLVIAKFRYEDRFEDE